MNHLSALRPGLATSCGSLPHVDPGRGDRSRARRAARSAGRSRAAAASPERRDARARPPPGSAGSWSLATVRSSSAPTPLDREATGVDEERLPFEAFAATTAFLDALATRRWSGPVKLQCTGPVTLGVGLVSAGAAPRDAFPAAAAAVRRRTRALVAEARRRLPTNTLVVVVDEPSLGPATLGEAPVGVEEAVDLVSGTLGAVEAVAVAGLHCCSVADWGAVLRAGPHLLSLPVDIAASLRPVRPRAVPRAGRLGGLGGGADERAAGAGRRRRRTRACGAPSPPGGTPSPTAASIPSSCAAGPSSPRPAGSPVTTSPRPLSPSASPPPSAPASPPARATRSRDATAPTRRHRSRVARRFAHVGASGSRERYPSTERSPAFRRVAASTTARWATLNRPDPTEARATPICCRVARSGTPGAEEHVHRAARRRRRWRAGRPHGQRRSGTRSRRRRRGRRVPARRSRR